MSSFSPSSPSAASSSASSSSPAMGAPPEKVSKYWRQIQMQSLPTEHSPLYCSVCRTTDNVVEDHAQGCMVCRGCGTVVLTQLISTEEEHRTFQNDEGAEDRSRASKANSNELLDVNLATSIARVPGQSGGLVKTQMKIQQTTEKSELMLKSAFSEIAKLVEQFGAPSRTSTTVQQIFKELQATKKVNSENINDAIGACLYKGLKIEGRAIPIKEVCVVLRVTEKRLNKMIMQLGKIESLKNLMGRDSNSPKSYIETYASKLALPAKILTLALEVADKAAIYSVDSGKSPSTVAAACIVFASQNHPEKQHIKTEKDVEAVSGITKETIRRAVADFNKKRDQLLKVKKE